MKLRCVHENTSNILHRTFKVGEVLEGELAEMFQGSSYFEVIKEEGN